MNKFRNCLPYQIIFVALSFLIRHQVFLCVGVLDVKAGGRRGGGGGERGEGGGLA